jgi:hypothetical protein
MPPLLPPNLKQIKTARGYNKKIDEVAEKSPQQQLKVTRQ